MQGGDGVLATPYTVPDLRVYRVAMTLGWLAGAAAGACVLVSPPVSYVGLGAVLTGVWGAFLAVGSVVVAVSHAVRKYKSEVPGLVLVLGGVDRKSTRLNSSHVKISYAVFCL